MNKTTHPNVQPLTRSDALKMLKDYSEPIRSLKNPAPEDDFPMAVFWVSVLAILTGVLGILWAGVL